MNSQAENSSLAKCCYIFLLLVFFVAMALSTTAFAQDMQRGLRNYQDIMRGKKKFEQLSPQEKQEVVIILRRVQSQQYGGDMSTECRDAIQRAQMAASELANYARRLRSCAEAQDYNDDCSSEFRRVKNSHSDYEDAVSSVGSYCR